MNWHERIQRARKNGNRFSAHECVLATHWVTCACGEQDPRIPRKPDYKEPLDPQLSSLGLEFLKAVRSNDPNRAASALYRIEARAETLIAVIESSQEKTNGSCPQFTVNLLRR